MNRVIKFRLWNGHAESMEFRDFFVNGDKIVVDTGKEWAQYDLDNDLILMQFTGLLDKNGKEIYEGDIISNNSDWHKGNTWVIEKKFGCFLMRFISGVSEPPNGFILSYDFNLEIYEIIGNIYESPNLLK